jgi:hypothetical protein
VARKSVAGKSVARKSVAGKSLVPLETSFAHGMFAGKFVSRF